MIQNRDKNYNTVYLEPKHYQEAKQFKSKLIQSPYLYREGFIPVVVVSVHGFNHIREDVVKPEDSGSLDFSLLLSIVSGSHWLAVGQENELDSNFHRDTLFKRKLKEIILEVKPSMVIDIHTAHAWRPFDIDVGSLDGVSWLDMKNQANKLIDVVSSSGFFITDNAVFKAFGASNEAQTITSFVSMELEVPAVQLEISSALTADLNTRQATHQNAKLINALTCFIKDLKN